MMRLLLSAIAICALMISSESVRGDPELAGAARRLRMSGGPHLVPITVTLGLDAQQKCQVADVDPDPAGVPINYLVQFIYVNNCDKDQNVRIEKKLKDILTGECRYNKKVSKPDPSNASANVMAAFCALFNVKPHTKERYNIDGDVHKDPEVDVQGPKAEGSPTPPPPPP